MPPLPPPPPLPAAVDQAETLEQAQRLVDTAPPLAFEKASLLRDPVLRERLRRDSFIATARLQPKQAAALLPQVIDARWLPALHFAQALDIAEFTIRSQPELTKRLLLATAARHPAAALRDQRQYIDLPYGRAIANLARQALDAAPPPDLRLLQLRQNPSLVRTLPAVELLRLAAAARTEEERETAVAFLRDLEWPASAPPELLRGALALLADFGAPLGAPPAAIRAALTGLDDAEDPLAEAVKAASILAAAPPALAATLPPSSFLPLLAERTELPSLSIAGLFPDGLCLQRYVFHNDDDGVESFDSFLRAYANDPAWTLVRNDAYVHLTGRAPAGRRIEIFANIPIDLQLPGNYPAASAVLARQDAVTRALPAAPTVLVHRGHDHHFPATRPLLPSDARLVFLGSCHGMSNVEDVVTRCRRAQMIATRGIGATAVNDTFLRTLNRRLLDSDSPVLDWDAFWAELQPALGASEYFQAYVPPHKNPAARFLAAWYQRALSAP